MSMLSSRRSLIINKINTRRCGSYIAKHFVLFCFSWFAILFVFLYCFTDLPNMVYDYVDQGSEDNILLYKDLYSQDRWLDIEPNITFPGEIPYNVHYFWCGKKIFRFEDYIGVLSIIRLLRPQKLIFHYHNLPYADKFWYHTWFQELKQSVPNLVLRRTSATPKCGSRDVVEFGLRQLAAEGGVYVGERTVLTSFPDEARSTHFYSSFRVTEISHDLTQGIIFSKKGFSEASIEKKLSGIYESSHKCYTVDEFNGLTSASSKRKESCLVIWESFYPKDIWDSRTKLAELARWLYYGQREKLEVKPGEKEDDLIPLVTHIVWMKTNDILKSNEFKFLHFLSVISALHVAGFQRVFIHGEVAPYGYWWDQLHLENVTFLKIEQPETIFQQRVVGPAHQSDVLRINTLLRHGGAYQDRDVIWVSKLPNHIRRYPAVATVDWPRNGEWPEVLNMGVMLAKPNADWLKHFLKTFSYYRDDKWAFNAVMMPYKAYEQHPETLYVDRYLQVICFKGICHPAWHKDYIKEIDDTRPVQDFDWREARAFHFTVPKPMEELTSPEAIRQGRGIFADMGKMILEKSGRSNLLR